MAGKATTQQQQPAATLTADAILATGNRLTPVEIADPADPTAVLGTVFLRPISTGRMLALSKAYKQDSEDASLDMIVAVVVDESGAPLFTREQAQEIPFTIFTALSTAVTDALGLGKADSADGSAAAGNPSPGTEADG